MNLRDDNSFGPFLRCVCRCKAIWVLAMCGVIASARGGEPATALPTLLPALGRLPLRFEAGESEAGSPERFSARGPAYHLTITPTGTLVSVRQLNTPAAQSRGLTQRAATPGSTNYRDLQLEFVGGNASARISGEGELSGNVNYFFGNDPARWRTSVPTFARVRVADLYPGVSLIHYGNQHRLEYDFVVSPGVDPSVIAIRFRGADKVTLDHQGDLVLSLGAEEIRQPRPLIYQNVQGVRKEIAGGYSLSDPQTVKFEIAPYDHRLPLVIDPVLSYSTYYGGSGQDIAWGVAVDSNGFIYAAGESMGGLPTTAGTVTNPYGGARSHGDAFVAKYNNDASQVIYLAYIGGTLGDVARSLAVDNGGSAYITGWTESTDFPRKSAIFNTISGIPYPPPVNIYPVDAFVTKLGPQGTNLIYSTYLGGGWVDVGYGIAVDPAGSVYVTGYTESTNFPTANVSGGFKNYGGNGDVFVTKFGPAGTNLVYSMYVGGTKVDAGNGIAADAAGLAYVTGYTSSTNFPSTTNAAQPWLAGDEDAFVTVIGPNGTNLVLSTYLGGAGKNEGFRLRLDATTNIYVTGSTKEDSGFPVTPGGLNPGGIFLSGNGGVNWNASNAGLQSVVVFALAVDPITPTRVYAGTSRGMARSADGGATWSTAISVSGTNTTLAPTIAVGSVLSLAIDPAGPTNLYAGTTQGLFKSLDAGTNWALSGSGVDVIATRTLAIAPITPAIIYAGSDVGVFRSTNGAATWSSINSGLGNIFVRALAVDPITPTTVYAATAGGVYRTTDSGGLWLGFNRGLDNLSTKAIAINPAVPSIIFVGTAGGVYQSVDGGTNWSAINVGLTTSNVTALAIDPLTPTTLYAGTTNGLFKSTDGGASWIPSTNGLTVSSILAVQPNPQLAATVYTGTSGTSVFGNEDAFLTKLGTNGFSVVLGGSLKDEGWDVAVDSTGRAHLIGATSSKDFPTRNAAGFLSATNAGDADVFVAEISGDGNTLLNSAYLGGSAADFGYGITVDAVGNVYVVGVTPSADFPTRAALQGTYRGSKDAFLAKISNPAFQPSLYVQAASNQVRLSWTALAPEYHLQSNTNLVVTNGWVNVSATPDQTNALLTVSLPATNAAQFFRLSNP
jgi:hypothetical protein